MKTSYLVSPDQLNVFVFKKIFAKFALNPLPDKALNLKTPRLESPDQLSSIPRPSVFETLTPSRF